MTESFDGAMRTFANFLDASWEIAKATAAMIEQVDPTDFMADWAQANWELLVETSFRASAGFEDAYLEPYGDGADCNDASSRVWRPRVLPTHRVVCQARGTSSMLDLLTGRMIDQTKGPIVFDHFATHSDRGWHEQSQPFDSVVGYQGEREVLIHVGEVSFDFVRIAEPGT